MGKIERIQVSPVDRDRLHRLVKDRNTPQKVVWRAQIVLAAGDGMGSVAIAATVGKSVLTVRRWRRRYSKDEVERLLKDAPRPPGRKPLTAEVIKRVVDLTLHEKPPNATHWSERTMAAQVGIAPSSVHKIWRAHGLKPHPAKTFKLSRHANFTEKDEDIVGLYVNPPDKALVLSVDEKSQIQALDRTQPGLPMKKGRAGTMTHDYKRHGTTTLFAALNMLDGTIIGECMPRHRQREVLPFLKLIDKETLPYLDLHLIFDNYATTRLRRSSAGSRRIRASTCTSLRPRRHGSTWLSAFWPRSPKNASAGALSKASQNWRARSCTPSKTITPTPSPSSGQSRRATSSERLSVRNKRWNQYTRCCPRRDREARTRGER